MRKEKVGSQGEEETEGGGNTSEEVPGEKGADASENRRSDPRGDCQNMELEAVRTGLCLP